MSESPSPPNLSTDDRRAFIRKGLVAGGLATALPIITTFEVPASASITSGGAQNAFMSTAGTGSTTRISTGNLAGAAASTNACSPTGYAGANLTAAADYPSPGSITVGAFPQTTFTMTINLPTGCTFANLTDAQNRIRVLGTLRVNSPSSTTTVCSNFTVTSFSSSSVTGTVSFTETDVPSNGTVNNGDTRLTDVVVRVVAPCS